MIQTFKIINRIDDVNPATWFELSSENDRPTRGNLEISDDGNQQKKLTIKERKSNLELRKNFFSNRVVQPWNRLPEKLKHVKSVNEFKCGYDSYADCFLGK